MVYHNVNGKNLIYRDKPEYLGSVRISNSQILDKWLTKNGVRYTYRNKKLA